jgi:hypothetical protein
MRLRFWVSVGILGTASFCANAEADMCSALDEAIAAAPQQFASLRGHYDRESELYDTTWSIPGATSDRCQVGSHEDSGYYVSCNIRGESFSEVRRQAEELSVQVESCLKSRGKYIADAWKDGHIDGHSFSSQSHWRAFHAPSPNPTYDVAVSVWASCSTSKRRGTETCRASVDVDLEGDER